MHELISVIVAVYNIEKYLVDCIESIIHQTYSKLEIILVDDGSTDGSGAICDKYAQNDARIKCLHKRNGGLSDARNYGLSHANGDIISFVDGDDYLDYRFYELLIKDMKIYGCDVVECYPMAFKDGTIPTSNYINNTIVLTPKEWLTEHNLGTFLSCVVWNKLYSKRLFDGIYFPVGKLYEDEATTYKLIYKANKIARNKSALYFYRQRAGSITAESMSKEKLNLKIRIFEEKGEYFDNLNEKEIADFVYAKMAILMISGYKSSCFDTNEKSLCYKWMKELFARVINSSTVPLKYKLYFLAFLVFPMFVGK